MSDFDRRQFIKEILSKMALTGTVVLASTSAPAVASASPPGGSAEDIQERADQIAAGDTTAETNQWLGGFRNTPLGAFRNGPLRGFRNTPLGAFRNNPLGAFRNTPLGTFGNGGWPNGGWSGFRNGGWPNYVWDNWW